MHTHFDLVFYCSLNELFYYSALVVIFDKCFYLFIYRQLIACLFIYAYTALHIQLFVNRHGNNLYQWKQFSPFANYVINVSLCWDYVILSGVELHY